MAASGGNGGGSNGSGGNNGKGGNNGAFSCNICLEPAREAVIGRCGHLYCWPCLHQWLQSHHRCAVCGSEISRDKVVPLYGRGGSSRDPRIETPPRPRGHRAEPENREVPPQGSPSGFHFTFGFGSFLFPAPPPPPGPAGAENSPSMDSVFLFVAAAFFLWLLSV